MRATVHKTKKHLRNAGRPVHLLVLFALLFAVVGAVLLANRSRASVFVATVEAEAGHAAGTAAFVDDTSASNGKVVKFGGGPVTPASARKPFIPVGLWNVNDQHLSNNNWIYSLRFVLAADTTMYRFFSGYNMEGVSRDGSGNSYTIGDRDGYARGNGGTIHARLTEVKADGTPDFSKVLAEETFNPVDRYKQSVAQYDAPETGLIHINTNNVRLTAGKLYAMTYRNIHAGAGSNYVSTNSPTVRESVAGPNTRNNLDPDAPGAIAGLDPREVLGWSTDNGSSWLYGRRVGSGYYEGDTNDDDGTRLPWYGWQTSATAKPVSNQPYYAYYENGNYVLHAKNAKQKTTVTQAGGYAPMGKRVGVVTVRNVSTGATASTASLGEGIVHGALSQPITVDVGQEIEIRHTGTVAKAEGDRFIVNTFNVGSSNGDWPFTTDGHGSDMAQLFVLPWPYYRDP